ncbi:MAG: dCTP deaminase [Chloroflexi bacterium]|nr:dCTP deaminase [Chloroflexota bacterium]MBI4506255.1 dCTP deaminase [Chloroflexota bacterium]
MAILTRDEILRAVRDGAVRIEPFDEGTVGPASIDLHLDRWFRVFHRHPQVFHVTEDADFDAITELVEVEDSFLLLPGQAVHGVTRERIILPDNLCGWLQGRSRFARLGLMVHITASFLQPGIANKQVLEMINVGPVPLALYPGTAICQLILEETRGRARYDGRFARQELP